MGGKPIWSGWLLFRITRTNGQMLPRNTEMYANCSWRWSGTLVDQVRHDLLLCISVPLECGPQVATVASGVAYRFCTGRAGDLVHLVPSMKVTVEATQQWSLREKNGGNQRCSNLRLRCHGRHAVVERWRMSVQLWYVSGFRGRWKQSGEPNILVT